MILCAIPDFLNLWEHPDSTPGLATSLTRHFWPYQPKSVKSQRCQMVAWTLSVKLLWSIRSSNFDHSWQKVLKCQEMSLLSTKKYSKRGQQKILCITVLTLIVLVTWISIGLIQSGYSGGPTFQLQDFAQIFWVICVIAIDLLVDRETVKSL